jgi:hypothetical protein
MKKRMFALLGLGLVLATVSAYAQTIRVKANVPFNFIVDRATLPAGEYTIQTMDTQGRVLSIRDSDQRPRSMVISNRCESLEASAQTKLVFHRYGDRYFLVQIWVEGNNSGHELPKSSREAEVAKDFTLQEVVLAALR